MLRRFSGTFLGIVVAMLVVMCFDMLSHKLFPGSAAKTTSMQDIGAAIAAAPLAAKAILAAGWFFSTLIGGLIAVQVSRWANAGWIVAALILAACTFNGFSLPGILLWMQIAGVVLPLLAGLIVMRTAPPER